MYLSYYITYFYNTFTEMIALWQERKMSYQLTLKMYVKVTIYNKHYIWAIYTADFNQTFSKMMLLGLTTKAPRQLILKVFVKVTFHKE